ncbi:DNA-directed RNA polymerase, mitochondrial [Diutina catenulata]
MLRLRRLPMRRLATAAAVATAPASAAIPFEDAPFFRAPHSVDFTDKTFLSIGSTPIPNISDADRRGTWSSSYDPVVRSPFARDIMHLQSLLDALIEGRNFTRAESILASIYPLSEPSAFLYSFNRYLAAWSEEESVSLEQVQRFIASATHKYGLVANHRTHAIELAKYVHTNTPFDQFIKQFSTGELHDIFGNVDILGIDELMVVFASEAVTEKKVPDDLQSLFKQVEEEEVEESPKYFSSSEAAPTINKGMTELRDVGSFGLKVIRHTLLGLKAENTAEFAKALEELNLGHLLHQQSPDYFAAYRSLTPEQQAKFDEALNMFNEPRQQQLEVRGLDGAREKWKHAFEEMQKRGGLNLSKNFNSQLFKWYNELLPLVAAEAESCRKLVKGEVDPTQLSDEEKKLMLHREHYAPYLLLVPPEKLCVITILELLRLNSTGGIVDGMRAARALIAVGKAVEIEYRSQHYLKVENKTSSKKARSTQQWRKLLRKKQNDQASEWTDNVYGKLGSVLISHLINIAKVSVRGKDPVTGKSVSGIQPAFHHTYQYANGQKVGVIKLHKEVMRQLGGSDVSSCVHAQLLPMLVPPKPWVSQSRGGFLYTQSQLVRTRDSPETSAYLKAAADAGNMNEVYEGLNVLGNTAWTINKQLFEVVSHFWNTGEAFAGMAPVVDTPTLPPPVPRDAEPQDKFEYQRKVKLALNEVASFRSQRCDTNYKLEIARAFIGEKMYFPHNVDFRGRAYPLSPHLNHLGNDLTRSLFLFWNGRKLGHEGLGWLKIHLANLYGFDKAPLDGRRQFADDNMANIKESAANPLAPNAWWRSAEKPWQALSVCFELAEAYKLDDPTEYVSHLPVHQDGTCNGLQHYAALGGDIEGARQVNLLPADRPQDVYKFVAALVQKRVDADAAAGVPQALKVQKIITRKVVKQTVMTNVYGVTYVGAIAQIKKQIVQHFDSEDAQPLAVYITQQVFASVRELFEGAHLIQDWLGDAARRISKSVRLDYEEVVDATKPAHLSSVIWTTPLGLPCVQPYRVTHTKTIKTNLQDISLSDPFGVGQVDARKQQSAFPPNFVHSLDATHMLMTARACSHLSFAAVHDSYWTHAADIPTMNREIRSQFIKLHQGDLVKQLRDEFVKRYEGFLQVVALPSDHPVVAKVKEIRKEWAAKAKRPVTVADELYMERKRRKLLASPFPDVRRIGEEMVTTVSVTAGYTSAEPTKRTTTTQVLVPLEFPEIPVKGDFDLNLVADSQYFFS